MLGIFDRNRKLIYFLPEIDGSRAGISCFNAANNVDSRSKGIWPDGVYYVDDLIKVEGPDCLPSGQYGRWFLRFDDFSPSPASIRVGMGLHSGRKGVKDGLGREDHLHCTMGCIRTEPAAMEYMAERWELDPLSKLWVE